ADHLTGAELPRVSARGRVRALVDVEVERLRAGREGLVERDVRPRDLGLWIAELRGDRVGDRGLVSLPRGRVVDLPLRGLRAARIPGREGRVVSPDRE